MRTEQEIRADIASVDADEKANAGALEAQRDALMEQAKALTKDINKIRRHAASKRAKLHRELGEALA